MKLPKLCSASWFIPIALIFVCFILLLGCKDSQDIAPLISQDAGPSLSAKEIDEATELMKEFKCYVQCDDEKQREAEKVLYLGGKMEDGKAYFITPKMRQRAVEENPEWRQIDAMAAPDLETMKAKAKAGADSLFGKKKRSEDAELAYSNCYVTLACNAWAGHSTIFSEGPSYWSSHLHAHHFYVGSGAPISAYYGYHGRRFLSTQYGPPAQYIEMIGQVTDIQYGCIRQWASYCSGPSY